MNQISKDLISILSRPTSIVIALLLTAILFVSLSILGVDMDLDGNEILLLSTTTGQNFFENSTVGFFKKTDVDNDQKSSEWQTRVMRVTAYCSCRRCCGKFADGRTASHHRIRRGDVFAAADKRYSFGTELIVPGYNNNKPVQILDRGRVIKGDKIDIFFNSHRKARKWGIKYLDVKINNNTSNRSL